MAADLSRTPISGLHAQLCGDMHLANFGMFAAGTLLTAIPTVVFFYSAQKYIVGGLTQGSVKG